MSACESFSADRPTDRHTVTCTGQSRLTSHHSSRGSARARSDGFLHATAPRAPADASTHLDIVCRATLEAAKVASDRQLDVDFAGLAITDVQSKPIALALVRVDKGENVYVGTARVKSDGATKAVARAIMDAINRPLFG